MSYLSSLPTSSLQQVAIALEILFPAITVVIIALRTYVRTVKGSFGLGKPFFSTRSRKTYILLTDARPWCASVQTMPS